MRLCSAVALLMALLAAASTVEAARSFRSSSRYRSSRLRSYSGSSSYYSYRGPLYTRRVSPSLMGALYFSYVTRYPTHFSYRRTPTSSVSRATCINYMALDNGSYIGAFSCPFLSDEPSTWTKCCGYETEQFCCDPAYDDSWVLGRGLSVVAIVLIIGGCLTAFGLVCFVGYYCVKKQKAVSHRSGTVASASAASGMSSAQTYVAPVQVLSKSATIGAEVDGSNPPPPYPVFDYGQQQQQQQRPGQPGLDNRGFEPAPYPLYPPPYAGQASAIPGGAAAPH